MNVDIVKNEIVKELKKLNYNFSYIGTKYLISSVLVSYKLKKDEYDLEHEIYPIVAKEYNKSINNIKCNITNATDKMYYDCEEKTLIKYINSNSKPGPKKIICAVLKKIKDA